MFDPVWRTETVRLLAEGIEAERAFDRLPILADALEEAGCDVPAILNHCRLCSSHRWGCWVVTLALGRPQDPQNDRRLREEEDNRIRQAVAEINRPRTQPRPSNTDRLERYVLRSAVVFVAVVVGAIGLVILYAATRPKPLHPPATPHPLRTSPSYEQKVTDSALEFLKELERRERATTPTTSSGAARPTKGER